jgi:hypothetical protein
MYYLLRCLTSRTVSAVLLGMLLPCSLLLAQPQEKQPEKLPQPTPLPAPKLAIVLKDRHGHATPERFGNTHSGAGTIDVAQPRDDTLVITMTGVAVAGPHPCKASSADFDFDLNQCFEVVSGDDKPAKGKLFMEAFLIGLLRGDKHGGSAGFTHAGAAVTAGPVSILGVVMEPHSVAGCDNLAINDHKGPVSVPVQPGEYHLMQTFHINAAHARSICGTAAAAEFAPDPALDAQWISYTEPFHGAAKKDFGFRIILRVERE